MNRLHFPLALLVCAGLVGCDAWVGGEAEKECPREESGPPGARLLTRREYRNTIADLLGETNDPTGSFPSEPEVNGYDNSRSAHVANGKLVESWMLAAESLSARFHARHFVGVVECPIENRTCAEELVKHLGRRAFRRPLEVSETERLLAVYDAGAKLLDAGAGLEALVTAILSAPAFLYRIETPIPEDALAESGDRLLGPYELASRLSYFLVGSAPDDELLDRAAHDQLHTEDEIAAETRRLLRDPRAKEQLREFFRRWLGVTGLPLVNRDGASSNYGASLLESLLRFTDDMTWNERPLAEFFTSPLVFMDAEMGKVLADRDVSTMSATSDDEFRYGLLTQPALLALFSHPNQSSPIARGVFVRRRILCSPVSPPPPNVDNNPPDPDPDLTTRELFKVHTADPTCNACHRLLDPLGFGFENYDQLGRYRSSENGLPIDASGELVETRDEKLDGEFRGAEELSKRVSESSSVLDCMAAHLLTFGLGHEPDRSAECSRERIVTDNPLSEKTFADLVTSVTTSYVFRYRQALAASELPEEVP